MGRTMEKGKKVSSKAGKSHTYYEKGSDQNGGREIAVTRYKTKSGEWKTKTTNEARDIVERSSGKKLDKKTHVAHKDNNKHNNSKSNLRAESAHKNIADGNKSRKKAKA